MLNLMKTLKHWLENGTIDYLMSENGDGEEVLGEYICSGEGTDYSFQMTTRGQLATNKQTNKQKVRVK